MPHAAALVATVLLAATPAAALSGDYVEARTTDVWTGPCFANGQVGLRGKEATLAWRVAEGALDGVDLAGLSVVAVVRSEGTLGDPHAASDRSESVILVDERATPSQHAALVRLAERLGGDVLGEQLDVRSERVEIERGGHGEARLVVGGERRTVEVDTRCLHSGDAHCGNETTYYPPLAGGVEADPAAVAVNAFRGDDFGATWNAARGRSAFVGTFSLR